MADQGKWFKLWCSAADDPDLSNLSDEDFGRWCRMGIFIKEHGKAGVVIFRKPAIALLRTLRVTTLETALSILTDFPNCFTVSDETNVTVTWRNWLKYQGDYSTGRVRKFREVKRPKKRGEEKRKEEKRITPVVPAGDSGTFEDFWKAYPKKKSKGQAERAWKSLEPDSYLVATMLAALEVQSASWDWVKDGGQFIPNPATWLNGKRWLDDAGTVVSKPVVPSEPVCECGLKEMYHPDVSRQATNCEQFRARQLTGASQ